MKTYSIFRNDKEVSEEFRAIFDSTHMGIIQAIVLRYQICWNLFCGRHLRNGGIIKNFDKFIDDAVSLGYCIKEIKMEKSNEQH